MMWRNYRQVRILERTTAEAEEARAEAEDLAARWEVMADVGFLLASTIEPERLVPIVARLAADHCADGALVVAAGHRAVAFRGRYTQQDFPLTATPSRAGSFGRTR
ncbi:MAG: hypothetical protein FJ033_10595 [Chloroflexi bacterium]|nr:hypothetical protein [Chloroflexota bacterium]